MDTFRYEQLDLRTSAFRLVRLIRGYPFASIECELIYTTLDENVIPYEAVSYTWGGTSAKPLSIRLDGKRFMVTSSLWHLLESIRKPDEDRYLWVDAIAINQDDNSERGHQVQRMRAIYSGADRVIFYLGEETTSTGILMESLLMLQRTTLGCHWAADDKRWKIAWEKVQSKLHLHRGGAFQDTQRRGLEELLERPWFRRVWVLQEVANARRALVCCGTASIRAQLFAMAPTFLGVSLGSHAAAVFELMPTYSGTGSRKPRDGNLCSLLLEFRQSEASDPRDRIFALLGLCDDQDAGNKIVLDYSKPEPEVIRDTIKYILGTHHAWQIGVRPGERDDPDYPIPAIQTVEEFLSNQFLSSMPNSSYQCLRELFIHMLHSCKVEAVRSSLNPRQHRICVTEGMVDAAASNKSNAIGMMILLLRYGMLGTGAATIRTGICTDLAQIIGDVIEMSVRSHGEVAVSVGQEDLYPLLLLASQDRLSGLIMRLRGGNAGATQLLYKLRQAAGKTHQNQLQDDIRDELEDTQPAIWQDLPSISRREVAEILAHDHADAVEEGENWPLLFMAIVSGETNMVELILEMNPGEFYTPCQNANMALEFALGRRDAAMLRCLLNKGVKIMLGVGDEVSDPLSLVLRGGDHDMINLFRPYPMNVVAPNGMIPSRWAAERGHKLLAQFLLQQGG